MPITKQDKPSKTIQCIRMLKILKSKQYLKKEEIASLLGEDTIRNINNYKNALYDAGYQIEYKPGRYGGYYLVNDPLIPRTSIKKEQLEALSVIYEYVLKDKNFAYRQLFLDFVSNILGSYDSVNTDNNIGLYGHFPLSMKEEEIQKRYYILQTAIESKRKVRIIYKGYYSDIERVIFPYKLYKFNNWHVYAIDQRENYKGKNTYTSFKLHRIKKITMLEETFKLDTNYEETEHFTNSGLARDEKIYVKLKIYGPLGRTIDEKLYGQNQKVELVEKNRQVYNFEAYMVDRFVILKFVLSLGDCCKVIEPKWLKNMVISNAKKILQFYKRDSL